MWWPFRKKDDELLALKKTLETSFANVKKDHEFLKTEHHTKISIILDRIDRLEKELRAISNTNQNQDLKETVLSQGQIDLFDSLTDKQKAFCQIIAALNSENPNKWISQKELARELYPDKAYDKMRSLMSQYLNLLVDLGYIKKRVKGKLAYIMTTERNPYNKEKQIKPEEPKKQDKKSKQS